MPPERVQKPAYSPAGPTYNRIVASTTTRPMTFAEFEKLPENGRRYELRQGELVEMPPPKHGHKLIERRLRRLLENAGGSSGVVETEVGFRTAGDDYRIADVAYVSQPRWDQTPAEGYLSGAPELVIEVSSPSNSYTEMRERRAICLENGSKEFWLIDPQGCEVDVSTPDGHTITYKSGQDIPLFFAPGTSIPVSAIFE